MVLDCLQVAVDVFEVVVGGEGVEIFEVVVGGFRSFLLLVLTNDLLFLPGEPATSGEN